MILVGLIDFIVNAAGLLLWFNWRATRLDPLTRTSPAALTGTLRRAEPSRLKRRISLVALAGLICVQAFFYRLLGPPADWTASLDLGAITLFFRTDQFWLMLLFSLLSFGRALVVIYFWLLAVVIVNMKTDGGPIGGPIRYQLGRIATYPLYVQLALPLVLVAAIWQGLHPLLVHSGITNPVSSYGSLALQGILVGLDPYLSLKYLIPPLLCADLIARYIYFGNNPFWDFLSATARNVLAPLRGLPLRVGKVDFAPVVGIVLAVLLLHALPHLLVAELHKHHLTIWPQ